MQDPILKKDFNINGSLILISIAIININMFIVKVLI